jgi:DNA-binding GntR family transcriptional regulator
MNDLAQTEKEHRAIAGALKAKDVAKGVRMLRAHFRRGEKGILNTDPQPGK